jgi:IS5 family transposase
MTRIAEPQLSFADLALRQQGVHLDPLLQGILTFLDQHAPRVEQVRQDLVRGLKNPHTGRGGITPSQTLRSLILMRVKNWDYRELRERINDGYTLRGFTDFDSHAVPKHDAFNRAFNRITPATLQAINQAVVQAAVQLGLEEGKQLRVDTTVVQTDIHFPTDATLLWDTVRTVTRLVDQLHEELCRVSPTAPAARAAACKNSNACRPPSATRNKCPSTVNCSASPNRCWKTRAKPSRRPPESRVWTRPAGWPSTSSASRSRHTAT